MSDLVEHVHSAVSAVACIHTGDAVNGKCSDCDRITRAAIAAVAEWMIDEFSYQAEMIEIKQAMAAALRAAAGSALEAKP